MFTGNWVANICFCQHMLEKGFVFVFGLFMSINHFLTAAMNGVPLCPIINHYATDN